MGTQSETRQAFIKARPGVKRPGYGGYWYRCAHCGKWCGRPGKNGAKILDNQKMEVDHIKPWSEGGSDELFNLQPLCKPCNRNKSANATIGDNFKSTINTITHPVDAIASVGRRAFRQNKVLKKLGLNKRK